MDEEMRVYQSNEERKDRVIELITAYRESLQGNWNFNVDDEDYDDIPYVINVSEDGVVFPRMYLPSEGSPTLGVYKNLSIALEVCEKFREDIHFMHRVLDGGVNAN